MIPEGSRQHPDHPSIWISPDGRVFQRVNLNHPERRQWFERKVDIDKDGYARTSVMGKNKLVHRLVFETWHGPLVEGLVICHLDGSRRNNHPSNLTQATQKENIGHKREHGTWQIGETHPRAKLTDNKALTIKRLLASSERSATGRLRRGEAGRIAAAAEASIHAVYDLERKRGWNHVNSGL
jgi:hypothetical protein